MIEIVKAVAWPLAIIIVAFVTLAVVWRITKAAGSFKIRVKDWLNLEATSKNGDFGVMHWA